MKPDINSFSEYFRSLKREIDSRLEGLQLPTEPAYLYDPIRYAVRGKGKRLRPILVCLSSKAFNVDFEIAINTAIAVELVHNFTLIHDDIMDNDDVRHGQRAVHSQWDVSTAILAGDAVFVQAQILLSELDPKIHERLNQVTLTICEGQALDKQFEGNRNIELDQYLAMVGYKTGTLLGYCAEVGGRLGGSSELDCQSLFEYGNALGTAFQIQDDLLEIFGTTAGMGKSLGSDLSAEKQTILPVLARARSSEKWNRFFQSTRHQVPEQKRAEFKDYFQSEGIYAEAGKIVESYIHKAKTLVEVYPEKSRPVIEQFTEMILNRTF